MLLDEYDRQGLLFNMNFTGETSSAHQYAYRGDLVLVEGEVADASGRRKPPIAAIESAVMLTDEERIKMVCGFLAELANLSLVSKRYKTDLADDVYALFFVPNVQEPMDVELGGTSFLVIPLSDGMVWNELTELLALEKSDFKGQTAADKVGTVYRAFGDYRPKFAKTSYDDALSRATDARRETRGPV